MTMTLKNELQHELINLLRKFNEHASAHDSQILKHDIHLLKTVASFPTNLQTIIQVCYYLMLLVVNNPSLMTQQNKALIEEFQSKLKIESWLATDISKTSTHKGK